MDHLDIESIDHFDSSSGSSPKPKLTPDSSFKMPANIKMPTFPTCPSNLGASHGSQQPVQPVDEPKQFAWRRQGRFGTLRNEFPTRRDLSIIGNHQMISHDCGSEEVAPKSYWIRKNGSWNANRLGLMIDEARTSSIRKSLSNFVIGGEIFYVIR